MRQIDINDLEILLSEIIKRVKKGEHFLILEGKNIIAKLSPSPEKVDIDDLNSEQDFQKQDLFETAVKENQNIRDNHEKKSPHFNLAEPISYSTPTNGIITNQQVRKILIDQHLFDVILNPEGKGIAHQYELFCNNEVVLDYTTGLMWQQSGSPTSMNYPQTEEYINQLNEEMFAGFNDWRLPSLLEAMSLIEPEKGENGLYIDPVFSENKKWIWTADAPGEAAAWVVNFDFGGCVRYFDLFFGNLVRAVRNEHIEEET